MRELLGGHEPLGVEGFLEVGAVDADGHAHEHLLRPFDWFAGHVLEQLGLLERFDGEEVLEHVARVVELGLDAQVVFGHHGVQFVGDHLAAVAFLVRQVVQGVDALLEGLRRLFLQFAHHDAARQQSLVVVDCVLCCCLSN